MANKEIEIKIQQVTTALMMEVWMEDRMVNDLNEYLDGRHNKPKAVDFSDNLVGQIAHGQQLKIDHVQSALSIQSTLRVLACFTLPCWSFCHSFSFFLMQ